MRSVLVSGIGHAIGWLDRLGVEYRALGSSATASHLGEGYLESIDLERTSLTRRAALRPDLDVVVPIRDYPSVTSAWRRECDRRQPAIDIEFLPSVCHFDFQPTADSSFLIHREHRVRFETRLFAAVITNVGGQDIVTLDPRVLLHTYVVLGGMLRSKDWAGALGLARLIRDHPERTQFTESDLRSFHQFLASRTMMYPSYRRYRSVANYLRTRIPESLHQELVHWGKFLQPVFFGASPQQDQPTDA
jgi:hypothetical protein